MRGRAARDIDGAESLSVAATAGSGGDVTTVSDGTRCSAAVIAMPEQVDSAAVHALKCRADSARLAGERRLVIDLRAVGGIDTSTLSELCAVLRRIPGIEMSVGVVSADPRLRWVIELCEIDGLELHQTVRAADRRHRPQLSRPAMPAADCT